MSELEELSKFHSHLGAYAVVGLRMAKIAVDKLGCSGRKLKCEVFTGIRPPLSCLVDGIQFGCSCTLGKGNIKVTDEDSARAVFIRKEDGKVLSIKLKDNVREDIDNNQTKEREQEFSHKMNVSKEEELFEILE